MNQETRATLVIKVTQDQSGCQESLDLLAMLDLKEERDLLVMKVLLEFRVLVVHLVERDPLETKERLEIVVSQDLLEIL